MEKSKVLFLSFLMTAVIMLSCSQKTKEPKVNEALRTEIINEIQASQARLPAKVPGTDFTIRNIEVEGDEFAYTVSLPIDVWNQQGLSQSDANSDKNIARVLSNFDEELVQKLIEARLGFKYIYIAEHNDSTLMTMTLSAEKMDDVMKRVKEGTLEPYTMTEIAQMELSKITIPQQIEEGVWLTDVGIKDGDIYYEAMIEAELEPEDMTAEDIAEQKQDIISGLREDPTFYQNRKQMLRENTHLIYIYKDNRGKVISKINISAKEIFGSN